ncbi:MAG: OmpH family outer membrane protein [Bacteroidales bacterium]
MKKIILTLALFITSISVGFAQKYAYVDSEYMLSNIPEFEEAQKEIDNLSVKWQKEIEAKFTDLDAMYKKFQNEAPLLTQELKLRKENEIIQKEKETKDLQKKRFGTDGDLFKKRQELIRPIQDKIYAAIEKRALAKSFVFVFDRSENANILFADPKIDISNDVLEDMGYDVKEKKKTIKINMGAEINSKPNEINKTIKTGN